MGQIMDKLWACFLTERPVKVTLRKWMNFGWRVATEEGLVGFIHEWRFYGPVYGRFFNNPDLKGKELKCKIRKMKENYREPVRYRDYSIEFFDLGGEASLAHKYRDGCIYAATVTSVNRMGMDILIDGVRFCLRKCDITFCEEPGSVEHWRGDQSALCFSVSG
jgi:ribosomal protein S1